MNKQLLLFFFPIKLWHCALNMIIFFSESFPLKSWLHSQIIDSYYTIGIPYTQHIEYTRTYLLYTVFIRINERVHNSIDLIKFNIL
jgi:hypothetical protein